MKIKEFRIRLLITAIVALAVGTLLIWDYYHGGVPSHHILRREDLPAFSNWWGGILVPLLTWFLLYRIQKRNGKDSDYFQFSKNSLYAFVSALLFGILLSVFFTLGYSELPIYMIIGLFVTALFLPIYRAECFLGFVLGMTFTFGGVLPILIISIFSLIGGILFLVVRPGILFMASKIKFLLFSKKGNNRNL